MPSFPALKAAVPGRYKAAARRAFLAIAAKWNAGSAVACPCCGIRFRKFARFHGLNDQCPTCGSLMRHRAVTLYMRDVLRVPETGGDVLHSGPGPSIRRWLLSLPDVRYVSTDIDPRVADVVADLTFLPFADESQDLIICLHVLEHVPDDREAIGELFRVLRPGGKAVIQVPPSPFEETLEDPSITDPRERERLFGQFDHVRLCGADYAQRLEEPGFEVTREDYAAQLDLPKRTLFQVHAGEPFYVCAKPSGPGPPA
jgi:SAM-dependent methyltransferase